MNSRNQNKTLNQKINGIPLGRLFVFRARVNTVSTKPWRPVSVNGARLTGNDSLDPAPQAEPDGPRHSVGDHNMPKTNDAALNAFMAAKAEIDAMLARLLWLPPVMQEFFDPTCA